MKNKILLSILFVFCFSSQGFIGLAIAQRAENSNSMTFKLFQLFTEDLQTQGDRIEAIEKNISAWKNVHDNTQDSKSSKETFITQLEQSEINGNIKQIQDSMIYLRKGLAEEKSLRSENTDFIARFVDQYKEALKNLNQTIDHNKHSAENSIKDLETHFEVIEEKMKSSLDIEICNKTMEKVDKIEREHKDKIDKIERENKQQVKNIAAAIEKIQADVDKMKEIMAGMIDSGNLAEGKTASESSTFDNEYNKGPTAATDGNTDGNWEHSSCTHTLEDMNPWWQVDLGRSYPIQKVVITNRADCCGTRLHNLVITVSKERAGNREICGHYKGPSRSGATETIICNHTVHGRYVKIQIQSNSRMFLTLCEVQVFQPNFFN